MPLTDVAGSDRLKKHGEQPPVSYRTILAYAVIGAFCRVAQSRGNLGHSLDADDPLDGEIGLVGQGAGKVICADLISRNERIGDQELGPLVQ